MTLPTDSRPIRILHVLNSFGTGGLEKGVATLTREGSEDFEHILLCLTTSGASADLLPDGVKVVEMRKSPGNSLRFVLRLASTIKKLRPDVVHTRNWGGMDGVLAARLAGIRSVVHGEHGWEMLDLHGRSRRRLRIRKFLSRWVREYTCVSKDIEEWLRASVGVRRPITQIYNGVEPPPVSAGARARVRAGLGIAPEVFLLGIVGRLDPIKDHPALFEAFLRLRSLQCKVELLVVGDGPERASLEGLATPGMHLLGDRRDVPEILRALDAFVLPSRNEGISNTILEAMAAGLPVVACRVGGNPEIVRDSVTGTLVEPGNVGALEGALLEYYRNRELALAHGSAGRERVIAEFTVAGMVGAYEAVYRRAAGARSGDGRVEPSRPLGAGSPPPGAPERRRQAHAPAGVCREGACEEGACKAGACEEGACKACACEAGVCRGGAT